jgi:hypothetical protein
VSEDRRTYRRSVFFPIILILLGIIFLLNNVGVLSDNVWDNILRLWPVLLIALGIDGALQRRSIVGPVFLIGLGVVFLLANYGYLALNVWELVFRLWPILLIAIGLDIVIGRKSFLLSLVGLVIALALLAGALWLFGVRVESGQVLNSEQISQSLDGASAARLTIAPAVGSLRLTSMSSPDGLVSGTVRRVGNETITSNYDVSGGTAVYTVRGTGGVFLSIPAGGSNQWNWDLALTPEVPIDLNSNLGAGEALIDLTGLDIQALNVNLGLGQTTVVLPDQGQFEGKVDGAIGQTVIRIPQGMAVRIQADTGIANINVPSDFERQNDTYTSPGFDGAQNRIELQVGQAIGNIEVRYTGN